MGTLMNFLEQSKTFSTIKNVFPVRGHSYMPVDRIFGRIEKQYRRFEEMISPKNYYDVLEKTGQLFRYGQDWIVKDIKSETKKYLKANCHLKYRKQKLYTTNVKMKKLKFLSHLRILKNW